MAGEVRFIRVRCCAYPQKNNGQEGYLAVCIDLSLSTWRPTLAGAKKSLSDAIIGYLETQVNLLGEEKFNSLNECEIKKEFFRRAPFFPFGFKFAMASFLSQFNNSKSQKDWYCDQRLPITA